MSRNKFICDCNVVHKNVVENTLSNMVDTFSLAKIAEFYKIIGDPTRCKIISILMVNPMCVCDICNVLSMSKSSVSHQLTKMRLSKIVKFEKKGKEVYYSLEDEHVKEIFSTTLEHIKHEG
ncbi:MAG: winged helix-turn-helix transcriptional regulator [Firmicutes bacterium]|nr:winged helix-turn-helix transcriptional regulator [Candidatus Caballimonas caccae]